MDIRQLFFKLRSYTPIPLLVLLLITAKPALGPFIWGLIFMFIGEMIRLWAVAYAGGATRTRHVGAPLLVTSGPFAYTRNPLYIANTLIYVGVVFLAGGNPLWIIVWKRRPCRIYSVLNMNFIARRFQGGCRGSLHGVG